mmetsp:Transcript_17759/g.57493  ORF Transcript_17759/g.57493 Transcript_17759/m.57493 type:complete len:92 (+) Transcript_17759:844-1119(+)
MNIGLEASIVVVAPPMERDTAGDVTSGPDRDDGPLSSTRGLSFACELALLWSLADPSTTVFDAALFADGTTSDERTKGRAPRQTAGLFITP